MATQAVLVTGSSSGLGLEIALHLAEHGFSVYASMRDVSRRGTVESEAARRDVNLRILQLDVRDQASIESAVARVVEQSGGIYGLINNAGINIAGYFEDMSEEEIRDVFSVNAFGTLAVTRAVLPHMRASRRGRIVIMSSVGGRLATPGATAYCASKFALEGFGESLAQELSPWGVYVSLLEPGIIRTELFGRNRRTAARAFDLRGPYYEWSCRLQKVTDELVRTSSTSTKEVAIAAYQALTARRPRLRYVVGRRARVILMLRGCLPAEWFLRMWSREAMCRIAGGRPSSKGRK